MDYNKVKFQSIYRALEHDLKNDFFIPLLKDAVDFKLATGFFTLSGFGELIDSIIPIVKNGGKIKVLTSPLLNKDDVDVIENLEFPESYIEKIIENDIDSFKDVDNLEIKLMAALLKENIIELKIVFTKQGIFHDKTGYIMNKYGEKVAYNGSANLTYNGIFSNIESISVYTENNNLEAVDNTVSYLDKLWNDEYQNVEIMEISKAIREKLLTFQDEEETINTLINKIEKKSKRVLKESNNYIVEEENSNEVKLRDGVSTL